MAWLYLVLAGLLEIGWAIGLKYTDRWTKLGPSVATGITMVASFWLLTLALRTLPVGTAYAVWTGIGAVGTVLIGMLFLGEPVDILRIGCIGLIIAGVVGLRVVAAH